MLDHHEIRFGGSLSAHGATRIAELLAEILKCDYDGGEIRLELGGQCQAERLVPSGGDPSAEALRTYLLDCIRAGQPVIITQHSVCWGEGGWKTDALRGEAGKLKLSGRFLVGGHCDDNGDLCSAFADVFGPEAPCDSEGETYLLGPDCELVISITDKTDLRALPREADRLLRLSEWEPPPLVAHGDLLEEIQEFAEAA